MYREHEPSPTLALHAPESIGLATFIGSPLAGALLFALNERSIGRSRAMWKALGVGALTTAALVGVSMALPDSVPSGAFGGVNIGLALGARAIAQQWFARATEARAIGDVRYVSRWYAAGVGLASMVALLGVLIGVVALTDRPTPSVELRPGAHVYYNGATPAEARRLGELLRAEGFFRGDQPTDVKYERVAGGHALSFVVGEAAATQPIIAEFRELAARLRPSTDPDGALTVRLCNPQWEAHHELRAP